MSQTTNTEKDLVIRLTQDDEGAFCELYADYKDRLLYFAMGFVKSKEFAEDIFQDAFTAIWQTRHFINPDTSFSTYLYTIVRNRILNLMRTMQTEQKLKDYILSQAIDYTENDAENIAANELNKILVQAVDKLTDRQRQIFDMSRNKEMSHKEIALALNISVNTVQEHISAALKTIQTFLRKHYGTYTGMIMILLCLNS